MSALTLITTTGARQEAFSLCEQWMRRQTYGAPVRWIIVDDGPNETWLGEIKPNWERVIIRPEPFWAPGQNTQRRNLAAGLEIIDDADRLVIIEDDDWYAPQWLETIGDQLNGYDLAGEMWARYYDVRNRVSKQFYNRDHASLCSTAMTGAGIARLREIVAKDVKYIDILLWLYNCRKNLFDGESVIGMKGMPGRGGIGSGHDGELKDNRGEADPDRSTLRRWLGDDAKQYERLFAEMA